MQTRERTDIAAYLHFGYLPRVEPGFRERPWARVPARDVPPLAGVRRSELLSRGAEVFRAACQELLDGSFHVVPLSGGVDSRLILGTLVQLGQRERTVAATFGVPGALDFELPPAVARAAGVRHEPIDLTGLPMTRAELLDTARVAPWSFLFEAYYNHSVFRRFGPEATYWSGSQANLLGGDDSAAVYPTWALACRDWALEKRAVRSIDLDPPGYRPETALPERQLLENSCLNYIEQLAMFVRDPHRNEPAQMPPGFDVRAPFRSPKWCDFILRIPPELKYYERLYHEIAAHACPSLFALPQKKFLGFVLGTPAWRVQLRRARFKAARTLAARFPRVFRHTNPKLNYADFDEELRRATPARALVEDSLQRLERARVVDWLRPLELWQRHQARRANIGDALALLASLELNLASEAARATAVGAPR